MKFTQLSIETLDRAQERFLETLDQVSIEEANVMPALSIADDFYQLCDSFYHQLRKDLLWFAE